VKIAGQSIRNSTDNKGIRTTKIRNNRLHWSILLCF